MMYAMLFPVFSLICWMWQERNHFTATERRALMNVRFCTVTVCATIVFAAVYVRHG